MISIELNDKENNQQQMFRLSHNYTHIVGLSPLKYTAYSLFFIRVQVLHTSPETGKARVASRKEKFASPATRTKSLT